jgi:hypothetical protein
LLNVFTGDAYNLVSLTTSINTLPIQPSMLGQMKLFNSEGITTTTAVIERRNGRLTLIPAATRGTMPESGGITPRGNVRSLMVPHLPKNDVILADSVQNLRAFGSNDASEAVASVVNNKLTALKQDHDVTAEYHRAGALQGIVRDADGSTVLYNLFTEFGVTEQSYAFATATAGSCRTQCMALKRYMEQKLGGFTMTGITALCSPGWFDAFVGSVDVAAAYALWQDGQFARDDNRKGFTIWGITFIEYNAVLGSTAFIPANTARFFPEGVTNLFKRYNAPATFMETVNTTGLEYYAKQQPLPFDTGIELHTQSNPLHICTMPEVLVKGTLA